MLLNSTFFISLFLSIFLSYIIFIIYKQLSLPIGVKEKKVYLSIIAFIVMWIFLLLEIVVLLLLSNTWEEYLKITETYLVFSQYVVLSLSALIITKIIELQPKVVWRNVNALYISSILSLVFNFIALLLKMQVIYLLVTAFALPVILVYYIVLFRKASWLKENGYHEEGDAIKFFTILSLVFLLIVLLDLAYERVIGAVDLFVDLNLILITFTVLIICFAIQVHPALVKIYNWIKKRK